MQPTAARPAPRHRALSIPRPANCHDARMRSCPRGSRVDLNASSGHPDSGAGARAPCRDGGAGHIVASLDTPGRLDAWHSRRRARSCGPTPSLLPSGRRSADGCGGPIPASGGAPATLRSGPSRCTRPGAASAPRRWSRPPWTGPVAGPPSRTSATPVRLGHRARGGHRAVAVTVGAGRGDRPERPAQRQRAPGGPGSASRWSRRRRRGRRRGPRGGAARW